MSEKPQKRLVSRGRYVYSIGMSTSMYSLAGLVYLGAVLAAAVAACYIIATCMEHSVSLLLWSIAEMVIGALLGLLGRSMMKKAKILEQVTPITRHNTGLLPEVETLVRASDLPPTHQRAELLRGVGTPSNETPTEELLRAAANRQGK